MIVSFAVSKNKWTDCQNNSIETIGDEIIAFAVKQLPLCRAFTQLYDWDRSANQPMLLYR